MRQKFSKGPNRVATLVSYLMTSIKPDSETPLWKKKKMDKEKKTKKKKKG
jgi:hypothetical protein